MRKALILLGDSTTTGGKVVGASATGMTDGGRPFVLHGDEATCGKCEGVFKIYGTAIGRCYEGRAGVIEDDLVQCPCGQNRIIATGAHGCFYDTADGLADASAVSGIQAAKLTTLEHWIEFTLMESGNCRGLQCAAHFVDGTIEQGDFDSNNTVQFNRFNGSPCKKVEILLDGPRNNLGSIIDSFLNAMAI
jgi:hypothetical protein